MLSIYNFSLSMSVESVNLFLRRNNLLQDYSNMHILDFILLNHDRHLGNYALLVDSETFEIKGSAPIYDNGEGCLCNYRPNMYKDRDEYTVPREKEFDNLSVLSMAESLRYSNLNIKKLINFEFNRSRLLDCPEGHIKEVEKFIRDRVTVLLNT